MKSLARRNRVATAALCALLLGTASPARAVPANPFPKIGSFSFNTFESLFLEGVDSGIRTLVATSQNSVFLADLDRMRTTRKITLPFLSGHRVAVDDVHHRLFVPHAAQAPPSPSAADSPSLSVVDLRTGVIGGTFTFPDAFRGMTIDATGYFGPKDRLYVVTDVIENFEQALHRLVVHELDASKLTSDPSHAIVWSYDFDSCNNIADGGGKFGFIHRSRRADFLYFACDPGNQGPSNGLIRLNLTPGATPSDTSRFVPEFHFFGGGLADGFVAADPANDRMLVFASAAAQQRFYIFDAFRRAWTGSVPLGEVSLGGGVFDSTQGRIYATQVLGGALITEGSWVPTPQGAFYPTETSVALGNPVFDPKTRRLFVPAFRELSQTSRVQDAILVYEDRIPPVPPPQPENPDERTQDIAEVPGVTTSTFSGNGAAYGARYLLTGGIQAKHNGRVFPAVQAVGTVYTAVSSAAGRPGNPPFVPGGSGRALELGRVVDVFADAGGASAKAIADDADAVTRADMAQIRDVFRDDALPHGSSDPEALQQAQDAAVAATSAQRETVRSQVAWPYRESDCVDFGNTDDKRAEQQPGSAVECSLGGPRATATASSAPQLNGFPVSVGFATSTVTVRRDPKLGIVVEATAIARNVDVGGAFVIGEIITKAEASAFGRPGTARRTLTRSLKEVVVRNSAGEDVYQCGFGEEMCDVLALARATDRIFPTRIRVDVPVPETDARVAQTAGGAQALVSKSAHQYWSDFNSNGESSYEVPGLVITFYDESFPHILQLAGVTADAHYTVSTAGAAAGGGGGGGPDYGPPPPPAYPPPRPQVLGERVVQGPPVFITRVARGVHFALTNPRQGLLLALFWTLAALPIYLAWRRRTLRALRRG
jgi:hypothetical protein